jgi:hypothetical protein
MDISSEGYARLFLIHNFWLYLPRRSRMMTTEAINTRKIAEQLEKRIKARTSADEKWLAGIEIRYDHGDAAQSPSVCQPTAYMGRRYGSDATLSGVDIVLIKDGKVVLAVEVEEKQTRPKIILGDIFSLILAEGIHITKEGHPTEKQSYPIDDAVIIIAVVTPEKGKKAEKYKRLERCVGESVNALSRAGKRKVRIVPSSEGDLVRRIERLIRLELGKLSPVHPHV